MGELTGLLTGANEVLQNIEKTSTGLVTISQRIRGIEGAGDEATPGVAKLGKDLEEIAGINLMDSEGQLRDTYDILKDLAEVYPTLTTNQRQYLGWLLCLAQLKQFELLENPKVY